MNEVLVLYTDWARDYWEEDKTAPYPKRSIATVRHLKHVPQIPGIGVYMSGKKADFSAVSPCFIVVRNVEENEKGEPLFQFHFMQKIDISSATLTAEIGKHQLFFTIPKEEILGILDKLGIKPPSEWITLQGAALQPSWQNWTGEHFLGILKSVSSTEYEDRTAHVFRALGFDVNQMGYTKEGEYPDGIAHSADFSIVYDCKNSKDYFLDARDKRALIKYIQDAKRRIREERGIEKVRFVIVAHSFDQRARNLNDIEKETSTKGFLLTSEALLYLLFKKLSLGRKFLLANFEELVSAQIVTMDSIDKAYGR